MIFLNDDEHDDRDLSLSLEIKRIRENARDEFDASSHTTQILYFSWLIPSARV